jgi:hypothetical protein
MVKCGECCYQINNNNNNNKFTMQLIVQKGPIKSDHFENCFETNQSAAASDFKEDRTTNDIRNSRSMSSNESVSSFNSEVYKVRRMI